MAVSASFREFLLDLLSPVGPVSIRRMFGGAGIFADGLMFALIAAPLGLRPIRASSSIGLGISVIIIFFYYTFQQIFRIMGQGWLEPALAAWLPNLILLALGAMLIKRANLIET